jgi:hypothetical protein
VRTTVRDRDAAPAPDLVNRHFAASRPTSSGSPTSPTCRPGRGSCTSPRSSTCSAAGWSAGRWPATCRLSSSSRPSRWRSRDAGRPPGSSTTATGAPTQYTSLAFGLAAEAGIVQSMGSVGDCYDCETLLTSGRPDPSLRLTLRVLAVDLSASRRGGPSVRGRAGSDRIGA